MNKLQGHFVVLMVAIFIQTSAGCEGPVEMEEAEDYCWSTRIEMGERIHEAEVKVDNFAPKKLETDIKNPNVPQKCDYYYCIFQELKLLNPKYDVPCIDRTSNWVKQNLVYNQAVELLERIKMCTGELANVTMSGNGYYFYADNVDKQQADKVLENPGEAQSKCDVSKEYMKCLSVANQNKDCPVFMFP